MDVDCVIAEVIGESTVGIGAVEVNDVSTTQKPRKTRSRKCFNQFEHADVNDVFIE
ncbi:hypothetical protein DPMN_144368 [Dreissena polymorpha]|uniref:Uncharacterized protein n=1 Tax=Dreissena polymorpha TaxID=45954 RepID=A0A9D4GIS6_DREPO|nr:hypothetical protein DPMN_144368 [Dreissena polymorpha]